MLCKFLAHQWVEAIATATRKVTNFHFLLLPLRFSCLLSEFENLAIGVLDECFSQDEGVSEMLVKRGLSKWVGMCALNLAAAAKVERFLAHPCCQSSLNSLWESRGMPGIEYWKVRSALKCQVSCGHPRRHAFYIYLTNI